MRIEPRGPRVELDVAASVALGFLAQPGEQALPVASRSSTCVGDEVVDIEDGPRREHLHEAMAGDSTHHAILDEHREPVAAIRHPPHACHERPLLQVRAELSHDREAGRDLGIGLGAADED